ncbi:hypothetical protein IEQ34_003475 [Dendrobium chrysotoxum]|uniref:Uncharacterized protein n=1 Tax=Dendrobium chrysotoxum TaxID=161865 RepID=A0AAV7HJ93_DENCH|nr:hypothetical protein IEQ34_003475 [Dendrobium chrysotoxum]
MKRAKEAEVEKPPNFWQWVASVWKLLVTSAKQFPIVSEPPHPIKHEYLVVRVRKIDDTPTCRYLEDHDAEAEDIGLRRGTATTLEAFRWKVPDCSPNSAGISDSELIIARGPRPNRRRLLFNRMIGLAVFDPAREAEVPKPRVVAGVKHDITSLYIPVDYLRVELLVQRRRRRNEKEAVETAIGHVVVDEEKLVVVGAPAAEADEVPVAKLRYRYKLRGKGLFESVISASGDTFHGDGGAVAREDGSVNTAKAAAAEDFLVAEALGADVELGITEDPGAAVFLGRLGLEAAEVGTSAAAETVEGTEGKVGETKVVSTWVFGRRVFGLVGDIVGVDWQDEAESSRRHES